MRISHDDLFPTQSPTEHVLQELQLYGYRPFADEPDPRPLPEGDLLADAIAVIFNGLTAALEDTRLEPDLDGLLWSTVNLFHRAAQRIERELDENETAQRTSQREQDGSEIRSVELERLTAEGQTLLERRDAFELMRDAATSHYKRVTGSHWRPRGGSLVNHRHLTASVIDSRDFIAARRRAKTELLIPEGTRIAFTGGSDFNGYKLIFSVLDNVLAKYPDMVLLHTGAKTGADKIAADWAANRKVTAVPFAPDFTKYPKKQAPFKRNDTLLETFPAGLIVCAGGGIQGNLADKAKQLGIKVYDLRGKGGA